nr:MAG TPA: hypothetical protein [Caudoviricetes sp.]
MLTIPPSVNCCYHNQQSLPFGFRYSTRFVYLFQDTLFSNHLSKLI